MRRLICVFVVRIWHKTHFLMARLICCGCSLECDSNEYPQYLSHKNICHVFSLESHRQYMENSLNYHQIPTLISSTDKLKLYLGKNTGFLANRSFNSSVTESSLLTYFSTYSDHRSTSTGSSDGSCSVSNNSIVSRHSCLNCKQW